MSNLEFATYSRRPFQVTAIQVTDENMAEVAKWCKGEVREQGRNSYIKVPVEKAPTARQTMAFVGDWILSTKTAYKVYLSKAFDRCFELVEKSEDTVENKKAEIASVTELDTKKDLEERKRKLREGLQSLVELIS